MKKIITFLILMNVSSIAHLAKAQKDSINISTDSLIVCGGAIIAQFVGGSKALSQYVSKNLNTDFCNPDCNPTGRLYISFVVEKDGSISQVKAIDSISTCTSEASFMLTNHSTYTKKQQKRRKKLGIKDDPARYVDCSKCCQKMRENAIEVVANMPKWLPGTKDEKPVRTAFLLPINYVNY